MPELKRTFSAGKMNKDLDERIVPPGEYRDAQNIEINTSEGSNIGAVQTTLGNTALTSGKVPINSVCVGTVTDSANDMIYWLVSGAPEINNTATGEILQKDYVLRQSANDTATNALNPFQYVFVDIHTVAIKVPASTTNQSTFVVSTTSIPDGTKCLRPGMRVMNITTGSPSFDDEVIVRFLSDSTNTVEVNKQISIASSDILMFVADPALGISSFGGGVPYNANGNVDQNTGSRPVNGLNILTEGFDRDPGGILLWTDNRIDEPRKLNIKRSIAGTGGTDRMPANAPTEEFLGDTATFHTRLYIDPEQKSQQEIVSTGGGYLMGSNYIGAEKENLTVIKKAPLTPPHLRMSNAYVSDDRYNTITDTPNNVLTTISTSFYDNNNNVFFEAGDVIDDLVFDSSVDFRVGDVLFFALTDNLFNPNSFTTTEASLVLEVVGVPSGHNPPNTLSAGLAGDGFDLEIITVNIDELEQNAQDFTVQLKEKQPIFRDKFPRFCYRYKYTDGEFSNFGPWSDMAFIPNQFEYVPKKGHNLGMINDLKTLHIEQYFRPDDERPRDVVEIDILYKETNNPTVYVAKTISRKDGSANIINPIWPDTVNNPNARGSLKIESETVHKILPSNQLIRPYDNVPRNALSQEVISNRVVYGNYVENYDIVAYGGEGIKIDLSVFLKQKPAVDTFTPFKSCRSIREYQVGIVYGDKYGRETPVLTNENATINIPHENCITRNALEVVNNHPAPHWASYYKYYVKETAKEYYNLVLDRWYNAEDGNIWLSFSSSERNKVDEETYLIIKNQHDSKDAVLDANRYKILAIENDAPDFIKINKKDLGTLNTLKVNNTIRSSGYPLVGATEFHIETEAILKKFGRTGRTLTDPGTTDLKDFKNLFIRFFTASTSSKFYKISKITNEQADITNSALDFMKFLIDEDEGLGDDVGFTSTNDSYASAIPSLKFQLKAEDPENRPEFDGRFFAKIEKDLTLEKYLSVLTGSDDGPQFRTIASRQIRLISHKWPKAPADQSDVYGDSHVSNSDWDSDGASFGDDGGWVSFPVYTNLVDDTKVEGSMQGWDSVFLPKDVWDQHWRNDGGSTDFWFIDECGAARGCAGLGMFDCRGFTSNGVWFPPQPSTITSYFADNGLGSAYTQSTVTFGNITVFSGYSHNKDTFSNKASICSRLLTDDVNGATTEPVTYSSYQSMCLSRSKVSGNGPQDLFALDSQDELPFTEQLDQQESLFWFREEPEPRQIYKINYTENQFQVSNYQDSPNTAVYDNPSNKRHRFSISVTAPNNESTGHPLTASDLASFGFGTENNWNPISNAYEAILDANGNTIGYEAIATSGNGQPTGKVTTGSWGSGLGGGFGVANYTTNKGQNLQPNTITSTFPDGTTGDSMGLDWVGNNSLTMEFIEDISAGGAGDLSDFRPQVKYPAIFETEPKENVDIELYYEASHAIPIHVNEYNQEQFIPIGSTFFISGAFTSNNEGFIAEVVEWTAPDQIKYKRRDAHVTFGAQLQVNASMPDGLIEKFTTKYNFSVVQARCQLTTAPALTATEGLLNLHVSGTGFNPNYHPHQQNFVLGWFNSYMFGNGVESDRIRDDFNEVQMDNGVKVSSVLDTGYRQTGKPNTLIYSGIFNSISGVNETNQFIQGEKITKQLSPRFGSIQKLFTRDTDINVFCEDKVVKVLADKDALFNADGNTNITASSNVLGQTVPYAGDFGISQNPESFAADNRVMYFADKSRGAVIQLSDQGMMAISDIGMKDFFADEFKLTPVHCPIIGTFDTRKDLYNISILRQGFLYDETGLVQDWPIATGGSTLPIFNTISFNSKQKGWVSFATFFPETGISINNEYYTFNQGILYRHHTNSTVNKFYDITSTTYARSNSYITPIFNDDHSAVKEYGYINYEGTQAKVTSFTTGTSTLETVGGGTTTYNFTNGDGEFFNLNDKSGWHVESITTDLQSGFVPEFMKKEGKWFGYVRGTDTTETVENFNLQGIGMPSNVTSSLAGGNNNFNINLSV